MSKNAAFLSCLFLLCTTILAQEVNVIRNEMIAQIILKDLPKELAKDDVSISFKNGIQISYKMEIREVQEIDRIGTVTNRIIERKSLQEEGFSIDIIEVTSTEYEAAYVLKVFDLSKSFKNSYQENAISVLIELHGRKFKYSLNYDDKCSKDILEKLFIISSNALAKVAKLPDEDCKTELSTLREKNAKDLAIIERPINKNEVSSKTNEKKEHNSKKSTKISI